MRREQPRTSISLTPPQGARVDGPVDAVSTYLDARARDIRRPPDRKRFAPARPLPIRGRGHTLPGISGWREDHLRRRDERLRRQEQRTEHAADHPWRRTSWSPDGTQIVYVTRGLRDIALVDVATGRIKLIVRGREGTYHPNFHPDFSPDGQRILLTTLRRKGIELRTVPVDGGTQTILPLRRERSRLILPMAR